MNASRLGILAALIAAPLTGSVASMSGGNPPPALAGFWQAYCTATPNSTGNAGTMQPTGSPSLSQNTFVLQVVDLPPGEPAIFYYGGTQTEIPFGDGFRCVASGGQGVFRLPPNMIDSQGSLSMPADAFDPLFQVTPGQLWFYQAWYRDPHAGGTGFNLSDGLLVAWGF